MLVGVAVDVGGDVGVSVLLGSGGRIVAAARVSVDRGVLVARVATSVAVFVAVGISAVGTGVRVAAAICSLTGRIATTILSSGSGGGGTGDPK